jgi:hypothetical protein
MTMKRNSLLDKLKPTDDLLKLLFCILDIVSKLKLTTGLHKLVAVSFEMIIIQRAVGNESFF